jgi:two-component system, LuxR family, sensor kinase FixL
MREVLSHPEGGVPLPQDTPHPDNAQQDRDFTESLIETAQAIILVLDPEGRIVRFNRYLEELSGHSLPELRGRDWFVTFIPEAEQQSMRERFLQVLHKNRIRGANWIRLKDGQLRKIEWSVKLLKDRHDGMVGILAIGQDITERENTQAALHNLIETTQDAVITIDGQGRIDLFNPAAERIFGYTREEVKGQDVRILMPEPYASEHENYIERYEQTGERRVIGRIRTIAAQRKNSQVFPIELSVNEIRAGNTIRYGAFIRDISEKVQLQEQLIERERLAAIGATAATFAHEVGNPLNSMYMAAQILERRLTRQQDTVDDTLLTPLHNLTSEMKRLLALLDEFRSLARRQKLNLKPISLAVLVDDLCKTESPYHVEHHIEVEQQIPADLPPIEADAERLKQVLLNLCKNAVEAMPNGGTITVRARHNGSRLYLDISDTGAGIPPGIDIFEPFTTTKSQGTGLGLTIVRQIVAAHKGTLTYRNNPDTGTTFTIELPISQIAQN